MTSVIPTEMEGSPNSSLQTVPISKTFPVLLGDVNRVLIHLVGCGGTGSFLALHLARLAYHAAALGIDIRLVFVDPDRVEEKNIGRQNFCPAEIGEYKAFTLARRYSIAYGLDIQAVCKEFKVETAQRTRRLEIVAGCVDNAAARREIARYLDYNNSPIGAHTWWLDGGNHEHAGQVHLGNTDQVTISPLGFCSSLPHPGVQAPDLLEDPEEELQDLSCADLTALNIQSLMINQAIAGWMSTYLYRLLIGRDLDIMATYINLAAGSTRSVGITKRDEEE